MRRAVVLPPIVVTPGRLEQPLLETGRSVDRLERGRLRELQPRSLPDALVGATGVHVQETNRGAGAPYLRGLVGPQNLIVVDDVRFNTSIFRTGPNQYLSLIDAHGIEGIEIVRGPSSVLYGNGAMGGVLQVFLRAPKTTGEDRFRYRGSVEARFASADLAGGGSVGFTGSYGDFAFFVGGTFDHFDTLRVGGGVEWPVSKYDAGYWQSKLVWSHGSLSVTAAYAGAAVRNAGRTDSLGLGEVRLYDNDDHLAYLRLQFGPAGPVRHLRLTASYHRLGELVDRANCATTPSFGVEVVSDRARCAALDNAVIEKKRRLEDIVDTVGGTAELLLALWSDRIHLATGFDAYADFVGSRREDASAKDGFVYAPAARGNFSDGSQYLTLGLYAHLAATVLDYGSQHFQIRLSGGVRYSHFGADAPNVPGLGDVGYSFDGAVGTAGLHVLIPDVFGVYGTFMQGFRAPNLQETTVLGNTGQKFEVPASDLRPERSDTIEAGAWFHLGPVTLRAAYFHSFLEDAIDEAPTTYAGQSQIDGKPVSHRVNAASGVAKGVEGDLTIAVWRFQLQAGVAWTEADVTSAAGVTTPARRIPPVFGSATLRYTHPAPRAYAEIGLRWAARQDRLHPGDEADPRICETSRHSGLLQSDVGGTCHGTPGYVVLAVRGGWQIHRRVRADVMIENLLDTRYRLHASGFDGPGVGARLTLTAGF